MSTKIRSAAIRSAVACTGLLLASAVCAQQTKTAPVLRLTAEQQALVDAGQRIAKSGGPNGVTACASCHGANGEGTPGAGFPRLAGQSQFYLNRQLMLFADGSRNHPVMSPIAKAMDRQQMLQTSMYYATLSGVPTVMPKTQAAAAAMKRGRMLADWGDESIQVQGCANCHGPGGRGGIFTFPYLAGQHQDYLQAAMAAWKNGARNTDPSGQMQTIAKRLSDADVAAVSAYFAAQPAPLPATQSIPAGSVARPVPPPSPSGGGSGTAPARGTGTEQGAPTSGGSQGPGGGGGTQVSPQGPMPAK
jgi:cytochrome c553